MGRVPNSAGNVALRRARSRRSPLPAERRGAGTSRLALPPSSPAELRRHAQGARRLVYRPRTRAQIWRRPPWTLVRRGRPRHSRALLKLAGRPDSLVQPAREGIEDSDERLLRLRCRHVGGSRRLEVRTAVGWAAAFAAGEPVAVVPIRGERGVNRLLEQIRGVQRVLGVRDRERGGLLQQALPVALNAIQPCERRLRCQFAAEGAADCRRDGLAAFLRLDEEALQLVDERAKLGGPGRVLSG